MALEVAVKTASYKNDTFANTLANTKPFYIKPEKDDGVFVQNGSDKDADYGPPDRGRSTNSNGRSRGVIHMHGELASTTYPPMSIALGTINTNVRCGLLMGPANSDTADWNNSESGIYKVVGSAKDKNALGGSTCVYKVEVLKTGRYSVPTGGSERYDQIYAMGFTAMMRSPSGNLIGYASWLFARMVDMEGDGHPVVNTSSYPYITNSSIMFDDVGDIASIIIPGKNVATAGGIISTAMSDSVLESNTGILAVACMVSGDSRARWVGYRNGVYKLYQGSKPLYGTPGERVTIKGHEFVCLAYGPFYARIS